MTKTNKKKQTNMRLSDRGNANLLTLRELLGGPLGPAKPRETIEWAIEQAIKIAQKESGKVRTKGST